LSIIVVVGVHVQVSEHIVTQSLRYVATIQLKREEHQTDPGAYSLVNLGGLVVSLASLGEGV
jgi:hypothetical protein